MDPIIERVNSKCSCKYSATTVNGAKTDFNFK